MLDPLTVTTTIVTLATFIKDLIELGEGIRTSIEKVGENRRQIRELAQDIVRTLYDLASLTRGKEDAFRGPELLGALENVKAEMLHVHSKCVKISSVQLPGLRGIKSQFKVWRKREDIERKIARLRERVNTCFSKFTAFSAARTEHVAGQIAHSAFRIEQRLVVDGMESQVTARRLEGMMAQLLLDSNFGRHKLGETIEVISSDATFQSLELQYMSAQLRSVINSLEQLLAGGRLSFELDPSDDNSFRFAFIDPSILTPSHALIQLLQLVVKIDGMPYVVVPLRSLQEAWAELILQLYGIGMFSEAIAWGQLVIACFRYASKTEFGPRALPHIASKLHDISVIHRDQLETTLAVELSRQSLDLWIQASEILLCDYGSGPRSGTLLFMELHAKNLLTSDKKAAALSLARDAVSIARVIITELMECISNEPSLADEEVFDAVKSRGAFFVLARVLWSLDRTLDCYAAFMEGFRAAERLPVPGEPPTGLDIDTFFDVICKLAEGGHLSLPMLTECMVLFRDLARIYRNSFSRQFLRLLHAFAYFSQQPATTLSNLRCFLEPRSDSSAPELDIAKPILNDLDVVRDAVELFYTAARGGSTAPLMKNIFVAHFQTAIAVLQALELDMIGFHWVLAIACAILPLLARADYSTLLRELGEVIQRFTVNFVILDLEWENHFGDPFQYICRHALKIGAHDEALQLCNHVAEYLACPFHTGHGSATESQSFLLLRSFIFCDAGRFADAIQAAQKSDSPLVSFHWEVYHIDFLPFFIMRTRILLRMGRHLEALSVIKRALTVYITQYSTFDFGLYFLFTELAAVWGLLGHPQKALENSEKAVEFCGEVKIEHGDEYDLEDLDNEDLQIHSFTTLSNCQAAAGKRIEALKSAQNAVSLYVQNEQKTWSDMLSILRKEESGGNAYFALSRRLAVSGDSEQALANGQKAINLYRELVKVAPRHLPTLANSLRHLASILEVTGEQDEAIAACKEAVEIIRRVVSPETYFLPDLADALDQLAVLLLEQGNTGSAAAVTAEASEARRKFASLPAGPEWLFGKVEDSGDEEDLDWWDLMESHDTLQVEDPGWLFESDEEESEGWELTEYSDALEDPASEGDDMDIEGNDECHDALDTAKIVEVTEAEPAIIEEMEGQPSSSPVATSRAMDLTQVAGLLVPVDEDFPKVDFVAVNPFILTLIKRQQDPPSAISKTQAVVNDALTRPLMLKLSMSMQSRPVDVIWWILLAVLTAVVYTRNA